MFAKLEDLQKRHVLVVDHGYNQVVVQCCKCGKNIVRVGIKGQIGVDTEACRAAEDSAFRSIKNAIKGGAVKLINSGYGLDVIHPGCYNPGDFYNGEDGPGNHLSDDEVEDLWEAWLTRDC